MQLIAHYRIDGGFDKFRVAFDADTEDRSNNGMSLLQLWREDDSNVWALYNVTNPAGARSYLDDGAGAFNSQAGVIATDFHFVATV